MSVWATMKKGFAWPRTDDAMRMFSQPSSRRDWGAVVQNLHENAVVLSLMSFVSRAVIRCPLMVEQFQEGAWTRSTGATPQLIMRAIENPNPDFGQAELLSATFCDVLTSGNGYWLTAESPGGRIAGYTLAPSWSIAIERGDGSDGSLVGGYRYTSKAGSQVLPRSRVMHFRNSVLNPNMPEYGLSTFAGHLRDIATDNESSNYTATILQDLGMPPLLMQPKDDSVTISQDQKGSLRDWWARFTGDNRGTPAIPSIRLEVQKLGMSPNELALDKLRGLNAAYICSALGMSPMVIGLPDPNKTYSNMKEAREAAFEATILPTMQVMAMALTRFLMPKYQLPTSAFRMAFDLSNVRELQEDVDAAWRRAVDAYARGVITRADARRILNLEVDEAADNVYFTDIGGGLGMDAAKAALKRDLLRDAKHRRIEIERVIERVVDDGA